ncbi:MAG: leucine-rich repeat domain-containing protein [Saprospirales bacterium]|nr:leucine-rich repeat domain-containing protein [Saprospirales bacterium]
MSELALKLIRENIEKHERGEDAGFLDLGNCGITEVPEEIGACVWLEDLSFARGSFIWNGKEWQERKTQNDGEPNNIASLPESFFRLKNLKRLEICGNKDQKFDFADLSVIATMTSLQDLGFWHTQVSDLSPWQA